MRSLKRMGSFSGNQKSGDRVLDSACGHAPFSQSHAPFGRSRAGLASRAGLTSLL